MAKANQPSLVYAPLLVATALLILAFVSRVYADPAPPNDPMAQMKQGVSAVIAVFQKPDLTLNQRRDELRQLAARFFDFEGMAKSVLGYQWRQLTPAQRAEFVPVFTAFIQDAYLSKLQDYAVRKVQEEARTAQINFLRETFDGPDYAEIFSTVVLHDFKNPVTINYLMHQTGGQWRIYDVTIEAISVVANYRNQFNRVINNQGFAKLVADLREKQRLLAQYMEHPQATPGASPPNGL